uniref:Uncharacterized protein n=1 Tax=Tetranychus urticae TaxID=32264 RepID=T1JXL8_TETUR
MYKLMGKFLVVRWSLICVEEYN